MSYFVSQHGNKLLGCMIFDQGIEKSDSFVLAKTGEEGVRFSGPFGSVHYINALKREVHLIGIRLDRLTKFTIFQWFKCIEKRHDPGGCDVLYGYIEKDNSEPGICPRPGTAIFKKSDNSSKQRCSDKCRKQQPFQHIGNVCFNGRFIEPESLLYNKCRVDAKWQGENHFSDRKCANKYQSGTDDSKIECPCPLIEPVEPTSEPE